MNSTYWRSEKGAAVVEFAVVAVLFLIVVFGIIELGILMFDKHILTNASREGARAGVVMRVPRVSDQEIIDIVKKYAKDHMISLGPSSELVIKPVTPPEPRTGNLFDKVLVVHVTYPFKFLFLSNLGFGPITLEAETHMRME
jgi:hypothetical protein